MKNSLLKIFLFFLLIPISARAADSGEIYTDPLFLNDVIYYTPIPSRDIDAEKTRALAEKDAKTMYVLGMMYKDGRNVDTDYVQSLDWFKKAAEIGSSDAMVEVAKIYCLDQEYTGVEKNADLAKKWIEEAVSRNNPKALYTTGLMYEEGFPYDKSYEEAFRYYKLAANKGVLNAYVKLYIAYQYAKGTDFDLKKAIYWLRRIQTEAPDGKVKDYAKEMLSDIYFELGLKEQDPALKFKLFNLAWSNGNRYAIEAIGDMFQAGVGVKQSYSSAVVAYETAAKDYESVYALERLGFIYLKGPGDIDRDFNKAFNYFKKGADLGGVNAAYMLGYMYFYGLGTDKNADQANTWFARSQQLAQKKQSTESTTVANLKQSTAAIKNIISSVNEKERARQKASQEKMDSNKINQGGSEYPPVPDVSKF